MNTVKFRDVLHAVVHLMGRNPDSGDFSPEEARMLTSFVNLRLHRVWTWGWWPELTRRELMAYREVWKSTKTYKEDAEVWHEGQGYFRSLVDDNAANEPASSPGEWYPIDNLDRYIPYLHPDFEPIGHVRHVEASGRVIPFRLDRRGVVVPADSAEVVWVEYRVPVPQYSSEELDLTRNYPKDAVVFGPDGHVYRSRRVVTAGEELWTLDAFGDLVTDESHPVQLWELDESGNIMPTIIYETFGDAWQRINFPVFLLSSVVRGAYADYLRAKGQHEKAAAEDRNAEREFMHQADLLQQQGQTEYVKT